MRINKAFTWILRIVFGGTYIFSGFVKAIDPLGTYYKINDYLVEWHLEALEPLSMVASIGLSSLEFIIGLAIVFGTWFRFFAWVAIIIQSLFTIQTLYIAIYNPVSDCGCFGDALILSNWETFYKNIVLIVIISLIFITRKHIQPVFKRAKCAPVILGLVLILSISIYSLTYLPIIDFRPYKVGNDIREQMEVAEEDRPIIKSFFIYRNNETGEEEEISEDELMDLDFEKYTYVTTLDNKVIKEGKEPPIPDFKINSLNDEDVTQEFLNQPGYKLMILQLHLGKTNIGAQKKINDLVQELQSKSNVNIWAITNSVDLIDDFTLNNKVPYNYYWMDHIPIKTIIRSNPGLVLLKGNTVIRKWPDRKIPGYQKLIEYIDE